MKKILAVIMTVAMLFFSVACTKTKSVDDGKLKIVTTIFPEYDWVREIMGEQAKHADITLLLDNGVDLHSFQPTAKDITKIANADLFIYVGGESDEWVEDALAESVNKNMKVINLLEVMGERAKEEELVEGMEEGHSHHHHHHHHDFADSDVKDRTLSEWAGSWQSVYPYLLDGTLDKVMEHKAEENGDRTAKEYKDYYATGYKTDVGTINIDETSIEFVNGTKRDKAVYKYSGFYIRTSPSGSRQARYKFEKAEAGGDAPRYVVFSDHEIAPTTPEHFHLYWGNSSFEPLVNEATNFPTYYPASLSKQEIVDEMIGHDHGHEAEYDEHVWLSLRNAQVLCAAIADALCELDKENTTAYMANYIAYREKLAAVDREYMTAINASKRGTLLFGDRFPFRYLVDDYGLNYYAAFSGCSAETEASFKTIAFLAGKVDELDLQSICTIESGDKKIARTIVENSKEKSANIITLDSMQSTTMNDIKNGATYLGIMEQNLAELKLALN
ncbi:MAG: ZinT/AdcA family metal-binding protein [Treponema sp.]|nr:ZinT/AdcA family metal-binding protein [Treponema sp.]